jgi:hypothetical protein
MKGHGDVHRQGIALARTALVAADLIDGQMK